MRYRNPRFSCFYALDIAAFELVNVDAGWYRISCSATGDHSATVTGGPQTFTLSSLGDFAPAESCTGTVFGASVTRTEEFASAFEEAAARKGAAIIELKMDPEMITTRTTLSEIRREAEARQVQGMEL